MQYVCQLKIIKNKFDVLLCQLKVNEILIWVEKIKNLYFWKMILKGNKIYAFSRLLCKYE